MGVYRTCDDGGDDYRANEGPVTGAVRLDEELAMDVLDEKEFDFALGWRVNGKLGPRTRAAVAAILYLGPIRTRLRTC